MILQAFNTYKSLPWPPMADDLEIKSEDLLPLDLIKFLNINIMSGEADVEEKSEKTRLCCAVTKGEWKLPKHILLCCTVRHLYRSKQLTVILNRLGHSESYNFSLELETALAKAVNEVSSFLTPQIITGEGNKVFHLEWDNLNKITTNVHGSNTVNSVGISASDQNKYKELQ